VIPLGYSGNAVGTLGHDAILSADDKRRVHALVTRLKADTPYQLELDAIWGPDFANDPAPQCRFFAPPLPGTYCNAGINHWAIRLNDLRVFPCPCMAGVDDLAVGTFDGQELHVDENWLSHKSRIEEPCQSCDKFAACQGGCRLTAMSDFRIAHGRANRFAGFDTCLYHLAR
jgi:radical SAM protein with 4Fe4S-binding SPASM domain